MIYSDIRRDYRERDCVKERHPLSKAIIWSNLCITGKRYETGC